MFIFEYLPIFKYLCQFCSQKYSNCCHGDTTLLTQQTSLILWRHSGACPEWKKLYNCHVLEMIILVNYRGTCDVLMESVDRIWFLFKTILMLWGWKGNCHLASHEIRSEHMIFYTPDAWEPLHKQGYLPAYSWRLGFCSRSGDQVSWGLSGFTQHIFLIFPHLIFLILCHCFSSKFRHFPSPLFPHPLPRTKDVTDDNFLLHPLQFIIH